MIEETLLEAMDGMAKAVEHVQSQFLGVRTGRASGTWNEASCTMGTVAP